MPSNKLSLSKKDYVGAKSTLCTGCGHDSVTNSIITALFTSNINPYKVIKLSGIGCSSKTPNYFLSKSHGFNAIHGRMAPVATGAKLANKNLLALGVSGDGDTASIGLAGFAHLVRRNLPMVYIIENNGVYGLTKGQFSATADKGSVAKSGEKNTFDTIDLCSMALDLGCHFVARSFSGDSKQLTTLLRAAFHHPGTSVIDIISPCVTFANNEGSTRSFKYTKEHVSPLHQIGFIESQEEILADYKQGETTEVKMHDGSSILLKKLEANHDVSDRAEAMNKLLQTRSSGKILTGLFYVNEDSDNLLDNLNLTDKGLSQLSDEEMRPDSSVLQKILQDFK